MQEGVDEDDIDGVNVQERLENVDGRYDTDDEEKLEEKQVDRSYAGRIMEALVRLKTESDKYLTPDALKIYSPKFLEVLNNIVNPENAGKHLIYSQFRTLEGIGIISLILEQAIIIILQ